MNGVTGCVVRGRGDYAVKSIFLPFAGFADETLLWHAGKQGHIYSSVPFTDFGGGAWALGFTGSSREVHRYYRVRGFPVRPVQVLAE